MAARRDRLTGGMLLVGTIGFGGGSALIPVIEREVVEKRRLLDPEAYLRHVVVANLTPGALPVKLAAFAGATVQGGRGSVLAAAAVAAPGVLGTLGMLLLLDVAGDDAIRAVSRASVGITAFIVMLLLGYVWKVFADTGGRLLSYLVITVAATLCTGANSLAGLVGALAGVRLETRLPQLDAAQLIGVALAAIIGWGLFTARNTKRGSQPKPPTPGSTRVWRPAAMFGVLTCAGTALLAATVDGLRGLELAGMLALSTLTSFGGGEAYIAVADGFFVRSGLVEQTAFFTQLVPIANALPGPILVKVGAGVGFLGGQANGALAASIAGIGASLVTVGACCGVAVPVLGAYERLHRHPVLVAVGRFTLPVICGLLLSVSATMLQISAGVVAAEAQPVPPWLWASLAATAVMLWAHLTGRGHDLAMLAAAGTASLIGLSL